MGVLAELVTIDNSEPKNAMATARRMGNGVCASGYISLLRVIDRVNR